MKRILEASVFICLISHTIAFIILKSHATITTPFSLNLSQNVHEDSATKCIHIERVSTKKRALDVKCFRGFKISSSEYIQKSSDTFKDMTEDEAIDILMMGYDDNGDIINHVSRHEREAYFVAVYNSSRTDEESNRLRKLFTKQNGVIGVVSAQIRNRQVINTGNAIDQKVSDLDMEQLTSQPHVYLANMKVDENMRRQGVASDLLSTVRSYAESHGVEVILLDVDNENVGAIKLYLHNGYQSIYKNDHYSIMARYRTI